MSIDKTHSHMLRMAFIVREFASRAEQWLADDVAASFEDDGPTERSMLLTDRLAQLRELHDAARDLTDAINEAAL